ncbi:Hypothetical_protein [Hexamita inflata]|uniref:Hypothetical_protein n=1 Tax=Hexamita inflata TaxID=28002 RepID=A0ABP1HJE0_9EUKA
MQSIHISQQNTCSLAFTSSNTNISEHKYKIVCYALKSICTLLSADIYTLSFIFDSNLTLYTIGCASSILFFFSSCLILLFSINKTIFKGKNIFLIVSKTVLNFSFIFAVYFQSVFCVLILIGINAVQIWGIFQIIQSNKIVRRIDLIL